MHPVMEQAFFDELEKIAAWPNQGATTGRIGIKRINEAVSPLIKKYSGRTGGAPLTKKGIQDKGRGIFQNFAAKNPRVAKASMLVEKAPQATQARAMDSARRTLSASGYMNIKGVTPPH